MTTFLLWAALLASPGVTPASLRCEYRVNPQGSTFSTRASVDAGVSRAEPVTAAYQILVASSRAVLDAGQADRWDSGKVASHERRRHCLRRQTTILPLAAAIGRCAPGTRTARHRNGAPWQAWSMGILKPEDWQATWIAWSRTAINSGPLPMFRRDFTVARKVTRATAYISGLGFFEL